MGIFKEPEKTPDQLRAEARARRIRPPIFTATGEPEDGDIFTRLGFCGWSSYKHAPVYFPVTKIATSYEHDLAEHKFFGVDGVDLEATGLGAVSFTCEIPFLNHIVPGKAERWTSPLYPKVFRAFIAATQDRSEGLFSHPEFGDILCRTKSVNFAHDGSKRGGVILSVVFKQTLDKEGDLDLLTASISPISGAVQAAYDLDASEADFRALGQELAEHKRTFKDFMNEVGAFADSIGGFGDKLTSPFRAAAAQVGRSVAAFDRVGKKYGSKGRPSTVKQIVRGDVNTAIREALTANPREAARRFQNSLEDIRKIKAANAPKTRLHVVQRPIAASALAANLGTSVTDLLALNPTLAGSPEVRSGIVIRYYAV